ncbi:MAG: hypothetical protein QG610_596 [Euryarchaeota archaeon]|nr:hypothetical protein [Euryarchaeota archaeon]
MAFPLVEKVSIIRKSIFQLFLETGFINTNFHSIMSFNDKVGFEPEYLIQKQN